MIQIQHLTKRFAAAGATVVALNDINLEIQDGDIYGIIGMSGAGKSTLVRCINMLERPDEGKVIVNGREMMQLSPAELRDARREITMIFQQFNLLMQRTCLKNICFPMELAGVPMVFFMCTDMRAQATDLLFCGQQAEEIVRSAFHVETKDGKAVLPGVVSRKKQLIPPLMAALQALQA